VPDGIRNYRDVLDQREVVPLRALTETEAAAIWHYRVQWSGGHIVRYEKIGPTARPSVTVLLEYSIDGTRTARFSNAYGADLHVDMLDKNGVITRTLRSGEVILNGCYRKLRQYDAAGRIDIEKCLDDKGTVVMDADACFLLKYTWSSANEVESVACFQDDMTPLLNAYGIHRTAFRRDIQGNVEEESYYASSGERTPRQSDGCGRRKFRRDHAGNVAETVCLSAAGMPMSVRGSNYAAEIDSYDQHGCRTERRYADTDGRAASRTNVLKSTYRVDVNCGVVREEHRDASDRLVQPDLRTPALRERELNAEGLPVRIQCSSADGPVSCRHARKGTQGSIMKKEYDSRGRSTRELCFDAQERKSRCNPSYPHEEKSEYGPDGRRSLETFADENGQPALGLGVARMEYRYNVLGKMTSYRFFDNNGAPANMTIGFAAMVLQYDQQQRILSLELYGTDGKLKASNGAQYEGVTWPDGSARMVIERSANGDVANIFYGPDGSQRKRVACTDLETPCYRR